MGAGFDLWYLTFTALGSHPNSVLSPAVLPGTKPLPLSLKVTPALSFCASLSVLSSLKENVDLQSGQI